MLGTPLPILTILCCRFISIWTCANIIKSFHTILESPFQNEINRCMALCVQYNNRFYSRYSEKPMSYRMNTNAGAIEKLRRKRDA